MNALICQIGISDPTADPLWSPAGATGILPPSITCRDPDATMRRGGRPKECIMEWDIAENIRCDLAAFTGINISGERSMVTVYPSGVKGDIDPSRFQSVVISAPVGIRVIFKSSVSADDWENFPWRAVEIRASNSFTNKGGNPTVRIPDLDTLEDFDARRTDPDFTGTYPVVEKLAAGRTWTYGRVGRIGLKNHVRAIRIERVADEATEAVAPVAKAKSAKKAR